MSKSVKHRCIFCEMICVHDEDELSICPMCKKEGRLETLVVELFAYMDRKGRGAEVRKLIETRTERGKDGNEIDKQERT